MWAGRWACCPSPRPRLPTPPRGSGFSRCSKIYTQGVYFWVYMGVLKGIRGFRLSSAPPRRACVGAARGPGLRDSGQRPRDSGLATVPGDICSRPLPRPLWK
jgi:hypothetical protein